LEFKPQAFEDLQFWVQTNPQLAKRLLRLIEETRRDPFSGVGKPEPLRGELSGWWSKRIDQEHLLVYQVEGERLIIAQDGAGAVRAGSHGGRVGTLVRFANGWGKRCGMSLIAFTFHWHVGETTTLLMGGSMDAANIPAR